METIVVLREKKTREIMTYNHEIMNKKRQPPLLKSTHSENNCITSYESTAQNKKSISSFKRQTSSFRQSIMPVVKQIRGSIYDPKRDPLFNFVRSLYSTLLVIGIGFLVLVGIADVALAVSIKLVNDNPEILDEDKVNEIELIKIGIMGLSGIFIIGLFKQVISWMVIKRNSVTCLVLNILFDVCLTSLFLTMFFTEHTGAAFFSVIISFCFLDILMLCFIYSSTESYLNCVKCVSQEKKFCTQIP